MDLFLPEPIRRLLAPVVDNAAFEPLRVVVRVLYLFYKELRDDRAFIRAAGMSYASLMTMVPMLVLVFGVLGGVGMLRDPGEQKIIYDALFGTFFGDVEEIRSALIPFLESVDFTALGTVSTFVLVFVAARLFLMVEGAYSDIFGVRNNRGFPRRLLNFYFAVTAVPILIVVSMQGALGLGLAGFQAPLNRLLQFALLFGALKLFPCTKVRIGPAFLGSIVSFVLLALAGRAFSSFIHFTYTNPDYPLRAFYGSLILIPVFLLWLYVLWVVVLLGVEVAHIAQDYGSLMAAEREASERAQRKLQRPDLAHALEILARIAVRYAAGEGPLPEEQLTEEMGLPRRDVQLLCASLAEVELLVPAESGWLLQRPAHTLRLAEVLGRWRTLTALPAVPSIREEVEEGLRLEGTLADAMVRWFPRGTE